MTAYYTLPWAGHQCLEARHTVVVSTLVPREQGGLPRHPDTQTPRQPVTPSPLGRTSGPGRLRRGCKMRSRPSGKDAFWDKERHRSGKGFAGRLAGWQAGRGRLFFALVPLGHIKRQIADRG